MQAINSSFNNLALGTGSNVPVSPAHAKKSGKLLAETQATENKTVEKQNKPVKTEQTLTSQKQAQQNEATQSQQKQSFELDEATLAFLQNNQEQNNQEQSQLVQKNESTADFSGSNEFIAKDNVSSQNQTAVSSYQKIDNLAQRESVQQLLGIDLYA